MEKVPGKRQPPTSLEEMNPTREGGRGGGTAARRGTTPSQHTLRRSQLKMFMVTSRESSNP
ncbi:unnamed protein product, partial [Ascophyllum nodosum]